MGYRKLRINGFAGLDTQKGDFHDDAATSPDAVNFICRNGCMETAGGTRQYAPVLPEKCTRLFQAFFGPAGGEPVLLAAGGGRLYALKEGVWSMIGEGFQSDAWRAVSYRNGAEEQILLVNGRDGMVNWDGASRQVSVTAISQGGQPIAFEQLTLLYERLWGAVHADAPDRIYWSESFEPDNWEMNYDTPDAGGGFIDVATFDGSGIRAIEAAFDDILIFKDRSMHRLNGTYPGEFSLTQVYGSEGTLAARTIVHTADRLYFLGFDGLCMYNGMSVSTLSQAGDNRLNGIWKRLNREAMAGACAAISGDTMYLALPLDGETENSHVLEYRLGERSCSLVELKGITDWLTVREATGERLVCLIGDTIYEYGTGGTLAGQPVEAHWLSPVMTMGTLMAKRTAGRLLLLAEAHAAGGGNGIRLTLISGGRERTAEIPMKEGLNLIRKRLRIRGRTLRFRIENMDGCALRLPDGMEMIWEEDSDL